MNTNQSVIGSMTGLEKPAQRPLEALLIEQAKEMGMCFVILEELKRRISHTTIDYPKEELATDEPEKNHSIVVGMVLQNTKKVYQLNRIVQDIIDSIEI